MKAPGFWFNPAAAPGLWARVLSPAAWLWARATARRLARPATRAPVPVICVGNLNVGGTGKTPVVCALLAELAEMGGTPHALSRGYGGKTRGPHRVDPRKDDAATVGDEPLLLAAFGPTWVSDDRVAGAQAAAEAGASVVVMDDGFQNPGLHKDLNLLVIDASTGFGNGRVIPAGPLREPGAAGLARTDLVVLLGVRDTCARFLEAWPAVADLPRVEAVLRPLLTGMPWQGLRCLAFAGIGRPQKFFDTLAQTGAEVVATRSFADHERYPRAMVQRLMAEAARLGAQLVTTEKDAVRLPADLRANVLTLPVRLDIEEPAALHQALARLNVGSGD